MSRSKYINTFNTTADYNNYIESALPEFPNVGYDKEAGEVNIRRQSPNDYQIWGTTTATENFTIGLNYTPVEVTVDPELGEFYLTGWTGTLTNLQTAFYNKSHITSIKKFALDTSNVTKITQICDGTSCTYINLSTPYSPVISSDAVQAFNSATLLYLDISGWDLTNANLGSSWQKTFGTNLTDIYITVEGTLMKLTNNLTSQGGNYIPSNNGNCTIHYNGTDYKWQNNAWTPQS